MTKEEALNFLESHQPMPSDENLSSELIGAYEKVRVFFKNNPDNRCIPLFLNSFGGKDGYGVYQMVDEVICMYDKELVIPYIMEAIRVDNINIQFHAIEFAADFPDKRLYPLLSGLLNSVDEDVIMASIIALAQLALKNIYYYDVLDDLQKKYESLTDITLKEFILEVLEDIRNSKIM